MSWNGRFQTIPALGALLLGTVSAVVAPAVAAHAATITFDATADTFANSANPAANYGTAPYVAVDASPVRHTFLKFAVSGLSGTVTSAKLRLHAYGGNDGSDSGGTYRAMSDAGWSETALTWDNQPAIDGATLGAIGPVTKDNWYEVDVTPLITGNGTFAVAGTSTSGDGAYLDSRESGANGPQLVVITGGEDPVLVGAGDIASCSSSSDEATAELLDAIPGTVFTAGDNAYPSGTAADFVNCYDPTWGRHRARTHPTLGNHDYATAGAAGYFGYFGAAAGPPDEGYYAYDLGGWHVVVLNSNCSVVSCAAGSAQESWLRADLAANGAACTLAVWHHPLFASGTSSPQTAVRPLFQALYDAGAEVVVSGHNHFYERFAPQDSTGARDDVRGVREFVVGTGGAGLTGFGPIGYNSEAHNGDTHGVLKLTLRADGYDWQFVPEAGRTFTDFGSASCH